MANFVAGDDDGNGGVTTSDIDNINLTAGTQYIIVDCMLPIIAYRRATLIVITSLQASALKRRSVKN